MSHLPADWKPSKLSESPEGAFCRNCTLFHSLMEWAGRKCNRYEDVMMQAQLINLEFCTPLSYNEVKSTAKSVSKYQARWEAHGWHAPRWLRKQKFLSLRGNQAKTQKNIERDKEILEDSRNGMKQVQIAAKQKENSGSDDWRNGIVLCKNHHAAFDNGLFRIEPQSMQVIISPKEKRDDLQLKEMMIISLTGRYPHQDALNWKWKKGIKQQR